MPRDVSSLDAKYPRNSTTKPVDKTIKPIAKGKQKKETLTKFIWNRLIQKDGPELLEWALDDVIIPGAKNFIINSVAMALTGKTYVGPSYNKPAQKKEAYGSYYYGASKPESNVSRGNYRGVVLDTRIEAESVFERISELMDEFGMVSVADLYSLVEMDSDYVDNNYGWTTLRNAGVQKVPDGWLIDLPKPVYLK